MIVESSVLSPVLFPLYYFLPAWLAIFSFLSYKYRKSKYFKYCVAVLILFLLSPLASLVNKAVLEVMAGMSIIVIINIPIIASLTLLYKFYNSKKFWLIISIIVLPPLMLLTMHRLALLTNNAQAYAVKSSVQKELFSNIDKLNLSAKRGEDSKSDRYSFSLCSMGGISWDYIHSVGNYDSGVDRARRNLNIDVSEYLVADHDFGDMEKGISFVDEENKLLITVNLGVGIRTEINSKPDAACTNNNIIMLRKEYMKDSNNSILTLSVKPN